MLLTVAKEVVVEHWAASYRNCVPLNDPARSGRWGKATPYRTGAERAPLVVNFSYSVSGRFRLFAIRNDSISGNGSGTNTSEPKAENSSFISHLVSKSATVPMRVRRGKLRAGWFPPLDGGLRWSLDGDGQDGCPTCRRRALGLLTAFLNAVISSLSFKSRRLMSISSVHPTRPECMRFGFASAVLECDDGSVVVCSERHAAVFHCLEACPDCWANMFVCVERRADSER